MDVAKHHVVDARFRSAVLAIDEGDVDEIGRQLALYPDLACERLETPGAWLRDKVGKALEGFFRQPYLLWFVAEDPVRNGTLPPNIADVARVIVRAAERRCPDSLTEQLPHALNLVAWSVIARDAKVQIPLINVLLEAGASPDGGPDQALLNGNNGAAVHLINRGAPVTLSAALVLERWIDVDRLAGSATPRQKQFALTLAALRGKAEAVRRLIGMGVDVNAASPDLYAHATPLHHAVHAGSLAVVRVLVDAGADVTAHDTVHNGTPLEWAERSKGKPAFDSIAEYFRARGISR